MFTGCGIYTPRRKRLSEEKIQQETLYHRRHLETSSPNQKGMMKDLLVNLHIDFGKEKPNPPVHYGGQWEL